MTVLIRTGDVWAEQAFSGDQEVASLVLPGFSVRLTELWVDLNIDDSEGDQEPAGESN